MIETKRGVPTVEANSMVADMVRKTFQITPKITVQPAGTIAREFEANIKAPRFVDRRGV